MKIQDNSVENPQRQSTDSLLWTPRSAYWILAGFLVILVMAYTALDYVAPSGRHLSTIAGIDKVNYFDVAHSLLFDHDFNLNNEFTRIAPDLPDWNTAIRPESGLRSSPWGIGYSVLEIPFLAFGTMVDAIAGHPADGYGQFARFFYAMGSVFFSGFGLMALFTLLYRASSSFGIESGKAVRYSLLSTFAVFFGTNVGYYTFSQISHAATFWFSCMFLLCWWNIRSNNAPRSWLVLGLVGGFLSIIRWQDVVFLVGPFVFDVLGKEWIRNRSQWLRARLLFCAGVFVCWIPQIVQWKMIYHKYLTIPQGNGFFTFPPVNMGNVLLSSRNGWFTWTPLVAIGVIGVLYALRKHTREFTPWLVVMLLELTVIGSSNFWHGDDSFGSRYMLSTIPIVALGLSTLLCESSKGIARSIVIAIPACCVFCMLFAIQFRLDLIPKGQTLTAKEILTDKLHLLQVRRQKVAVQGAMKLVKEGNAAGAIQMLESAETVGEDRDVLSALTEAYKAGGRTAEAEDAAARLKRLMDRRL